MKFLKRWAAAPPLHFLLLGAALYSLVAAWPQPKPPLPAIDAERLEARRVEWLRRTGAAPGAEALAAMRREMLDEELLFIEGLRLGAHLSDLVVWRRLARNMRFIGEEGTDAELLRKALDIGMHLDDIVVRRRVLQIMEARVAAGLGAPPEAELRADYQRRLATEFTYPRVAFEQVFYSNQQRGREAAWRAAQAQRDGRCAASRMAGGDHYPGGARRHPLLTKAQIAKRFGGLFAEALINADAAETCLGPMRSVYGAHWVRVLERRVDQLSFEQARPRLQEDWRRRRLRDALAETVARLRLNYAPAEERNAAR